MTDVSRLSQAEIETDFGQLCRLSRPGLPAQYNHLMNPYQILDLIHPLADRQGTGICDPRQILTALLETVLRFPDAVPQLHKPLGVVSTSGLTLFQIAKLSKQTVPIPQHALLDLLRIGKVIENRAHGYTMGGSMLLLVDELIVKKYQPGTMDGFYPTII
jgi:hypothetical protein